MSTGEGGEGLPNRQIIMIKEYKSEKAGAWLIIHKAGTEDRWSQGGADREAGQQVRWKVEREGPHVPHKRRSGA